MNALVGDPTENMDTGLDVTDDKFETDVPDVYADGYVEHGTLKFPKFEVDQSSFFQNMELGRRRLRFPSGTPAQAYMQNTRYRNPFYISYRDEKDGKVYTRKIK